MYQAVKLHVPKKVHEKLKSLIAKDQGIPVKINLQEGDDLLLLTPVSLRRTNKMKMYNKVRNKPFNIVNKNVRGNKIYLKIIIVVQNDLCVQNMPH